MANTTWNPSDKSTQVTLSNGNLTAAFAGVAGQGVRTVAGQNSGKYYFEYKGTAWSGGNLVAGIGVATTSLTTLYAGNSSADCVVVETGGYLFVDGAASGNIGATPAGAVVGIALDVTNQLIWFRIAPSGNWNGSGTANPATGTGGLSTASVTSGGVSVYGVTGTAVGAGDTIIANFGDSAFTGAVPSGFTAGFPSASLPPNYVDFAGNLGAVSLYGKGLYGAALYSSGGPFSPVIAGDITLVGQQFFAGDLAPAITFNGSVGFDFSFTADLPPQVAFSADLTLVTVLSSDLAPQVTFSADLSLDIAFQAALTGRLDPAVGFAASSMISGPLWGDAEPCPPPLWTETEPCPPSLWTPVDCGQAAWQKVDLCHG